MMIKTISKLSIPLTAALVAITVIYFLLPTGVDASDVPAPEGVALLDSVPPVLPPSLNVADLKISLGSGSVPEIAANNTFAAVVYAENRGSGKSIYLVSGDVGNNGWRRTLLASGSGVVAMVPKVVLRGSNTAHVVWNSDDGKAIRHRACTLVAGVTPKCGVVSNIFSNTVQGSLGAPDMAYDSISNTLHVGWFDTNSDRIRTARVTPVATTTLPVWTNTQNTASFSNYLDEGPVVLAVGSNALHVALKAKQTATSYWEFRYHRLNKATHIQNATRGWEYSSFIGQIYNPAIAASGNNVFMAWDAFTSLNKFNLIGLKSTTGGGGDLTDWLNSGVPRHITSTNNIGVVDPIDNKESQETGVPIEERALRPSLAFNPSTSAFSIVWGQKPPAGGASSSIVANATNSTSEIFYAAPDTAWIADQLANNNSEYSVDPAIAIDNNGIVHVVFMKAASSSPQGGDTADYAIYYRGPYQGAFDAGISSVYLPIVIKNN